MQKAETYLFSLSLESLIAKIENLEDWSPVPVVVTEFHSDVSKLVAKIEKSNFERRCLELVIPELNTTVNKFLTAINPQVSFTDGKMKEVKFRSAMKQVETAMRDIVNEGNALVMLPSVEILKEFQRHARKTNSGLELIVSNENPERRLRMVPTLSLVK